MPVRKPPKNPLHNYARYSALALQMGFLTLGLAYGGVKLDEYLEMQIPVFTLVLSLLGVAAAMYLLLKDVLKPRK